MSVFDKVEDWGMYRPGGFHPVLLGDGLAEGRFSVCAKLGNGSFGTVWLCQDLLKNAWKAVKVLAASASDDSDCSDLAVLDQFMDTTPEERASQHICLPEEYFFEDGPNGRHLCLVLPLLGQSLERFWYSHGAEPALIRYVCGQLVEAMHNLHKRKICHGDFRPANILFRLADMDDLSYDEMMAMVPESHYLQAYLPEPTDEDPEPELSPHVPAYLCTATNVSAAAGHTTVGIMVTDFGEAYRGDNGAEFDGIPLAYAAPEAIIGGEPLGYATDIWALGATICEIRQGQSPFYDDSKTSYVRRLEELLGPLPEPYRSASCNDPEINTSACTPGSDDCMVTMTADELKELKEDLVNKYGYADALREAAYESHEFAIPMQDGEDLCAYERPSPIAGYKAVKYQTAPEEASLMHDLLQKIFKYHQTERLTLNGMMIHPYFADYFDQDAIRDEIKVADDSKLAETSDNTMASAPPEVTGSVDLKEDEAGPHQNTLLDIMSHPLFTDFFRQATISSQAAKGESKAMDDSKLAKTSEDTMSSTPDKGISSVPLKEEKLKVDYSAFGHTTTPSVGVVGDVLKNHPMKAVKEQAVEVNFDEAMKDPFGPIYEECKRRWQEEHPNHKVVREPHHTQTGVGSDTGFFTSVFGCQVM